MTDIPLSSGIVVRGDDAERLAFPTNVTRLLAEGAGTNGAFSVIRSTMKPGADGARPHHHAIATELFFVISGSVDILVGDAIVTAAAGDIASVSPNTMHAFANGSATDDADLLIVFGPGVERFDYFRLLRRVIAGEATIAEVLATQERFDNWFSDSAAWAAHQEAVKRQYT